MKKKIFTAAATLTIAGFLCLCGWLILGSGSAYYARIDNSRLQQSDSDEGVINLQGNGGLAYTYTLPAYNENGNEKEITFGASRELKEGAFVRLTVMPIRGVLEWSEAQYNELPEAVQSHYTPATDTTN